MFVRYGLALTGVGIAVGLAAAAVTSRLLSSLLFGVKPLDPLTYGLTAMILLGAALGASYIPARRPVSVDPIETLRGE
jgi:ABC-type antimicrobial peptide transport system permease subunit